MANSSRQVFSVSQFGLTRTIQLTFVKYDRGTPCGGQGEGGEADTVFVLEDGATLRNVIIGADQSEGVYCLG
jgi:hypothetical protein